MDLRTISDIYSAPKNIGHNKWKTYKIGDLQIGENYFGILKNRAHSIWLTEYTKVFRETYTHATKTSYNSYLPTYKKNLISSDMKSIMLTNLFLKKNLSYLDSINNTNIYVKKSNIFEKKHYFSNYNNNYLMDSSIDFKSILKRYLNREEKLKFKNKTKFYKAFKKDFRFKKSLILLPYDKSFKEIYNDGHTHKELYGSLPWYEFWWRIFDGENSNHNQKKNNIIQYFKNIRANLYTQNSCLRVDDQQFNYSFNISSFLKKRPKYFLGEGFINPEKNFDGYVKMKDAPRRALSREKFYKNKTINEFNELTYGKLLEKKSKSKPKPKPELESSLIPFKYKPRTEDIKKLELLDKEKYLRLYEDNDNVLSRTILKSNYIFFKKYIYDSIFEKNDLGFLSDSIKSTKHEDWTRIHKPTWGKKIPLRILKNPNTSLFFDQKKPYRMFKFRFNCSNDKMTFKPIRNTVYLTFKQKRSLLKSNPGNITKIKTHTGIIPVFDPKKPIKALLQKSVITENPNKPNIAYKFFKKSKNRSEHFSRGKWNRLLRSRRVLVLPTYVNITVITNSYDIVHSWHIPGLGLKMDCLPGRATHHTLFIDHPGFYYGQCAEVCGRYHHHMPIRICALPIEHFLMWWTTFALPKFMFVSLDKKGNDPIPFSRARVMGERYSW